MMLASAIAVALAADAAGVRAAGPAPAASPMAAVGASSAAARHFMPDAAASKIMSVARGGPAMANIVILTEAVAVKETGPKATIAHFGEVYAFAPAFVAVHRDERTRITLWNLQPDDEHDFMVEDPGGRALMHLRLAPLSKTAYVFTFHREGLFTFRCAIHQPEMNGQIMVLPARRR